MKEFLLAKWRIFFGRLIQAAPPCLLLMVQGNFSAIELKHWVIAVQTGVLTGIIAIAVSFCFREKDWHENKYVLAAITSICTAIADRITHPTHFGNDVSEALVTGMAAGLLCFVMAHTNLDKRLR
jgi:hypothetical protein